MRSWVLSYSVDMVSLWHKSINQPWGNNRNGKWRRPSIWTVVVVEPQFYFFLCVYQWYAWKLLCLRTVEQQSMHFKVWVKFYFIKLLNYDSQTVWEHKHTQNIVLFLFIYFDRHFSRVPIDLLLYLPWPCCCCCYCDCCCSDVVPIKFFFPFLIPILISGLWISADTECWSDTGDI